MRPRFEHAKNVGRKFYSEICKDLPYPIDLVYLAYFLGIGIKDTNIYGEDGFIMYKPNNKKYKIIIDYSGKSLRKRFTLAHEIGHIILKHFEQYDVETLTDIEKKVLDVEADVFAGELLMPYSKIKGLNCGSIAMAKTFAVTSNAIDTRLKFLGIDFKETSELFKHAESANNILKFKQPVYFYDKETDLELERQLKISEDRWLYDF